jgi:hypothetical protein
LIFLKSNVSDDVIGLLTKKRDFVFYRFLLSAYTVREKFYQDVKKAEQVRELERQFNVNIPGYDTFSYLNYPACFSPTQVKIPVSGDFVEIPRFRQLRIHFHQIIIFKLSIMFIIHLWTFRKSFWRETRCKTITSSLEDLFDIFPS